MNEFHVLSALAGGVLIGSASLLLGLGAGRVAGISGIVGGLLAHQVNDRAWRVSFLAGLPVSAFLVWTASLGERPRIESGPSLADLATGDLSVVLFVAAMAAGILLHRLYVRVTTRSDAEVDAILMTEDG